MSLAEDPSRYMKARYKALEKDLNPREGLKTKNRQTSLSFSTLAESHTSYHKPQGNESLTASMSCEFILSFPAINAYRANVICRMLQHWGWTAKRMDKCFLLWEPHPHKLSQFSAATVWDPLLSSGRYLVHIPKSFLNFSFAKQSCWFS